MDAAEIVWSFGFSTCLQEYWFVVNKNYLRVSILQMVWKKVKYCVDIYLDN
jgi:hypothetical protein